MAVSQEKTASVREKIVHEFAMWTALSATRSGSPVKAREHIYFALDSVNFNCLFDASKGVIIEDEFTCWHKQTVTDLVQVRFNSKSKAQIAEKRLNFGWAAKIVNVYLKTRCYVGGYGRNGLIDLIHPPLDNGLINGLMNRFPNERFITSAIKKFKIKDINSYSCYERVIQSCEHAAKLSDCSLIEVEQFWEGTSY